MKKQRVLLGLSGGVDSSVSALLLKEQGYEVECLFMKNWEEDDTETYCSAQIDREDAQSICDQLAIRLHTINFAAEYWDQVFSVALGEHRKGRTPNPDILCNKEIKFKTFLNYALQQGADFIATGHYVDKRLQQGTYQLLKSRDSTKDQSYFLYTLDQTSLAKTLFPLSCLTKKEVRRIASQAGFVTAQKKDSTGLCFIGERHFKSFLQTYLPRQPGNIETLDGRVLGQHDGLMFYTIGQRRGLHIGGVKKTESKPWYVTRKDLSRNVLIVVQGHNHPSLYTQSLVCQQPHWIAGTPPQFPLYCAAKSRYRQNESLCLVKPSSIEGNYWVTFQQPQRAITPGQSIVFYQGRICLGGGIIG